jgi:hypothetical protein
MIAAFAFGIRIDWHTSAAQAALVALFVTRTFYVSAVEIRGQHHMDARLR